MVLLIRKTEVYISIFPKRKIMESSRALTKQKCSKLPNISKKISKILIRNIHWILLYGVLLRKINRATSHLSKVRSARDVRDGTSNARQCLFQLWENK